MLELGATVFGDVLVVGRVVVVAAPTKGGGIRSVCGRIGRVGASETFACRVEAVVNVATDGLACTVDGFDGAVEETRMTGERISV